MLAFTKTKPAPDDVPLVVVTVTTTVPADSAGEMAVMEVEELTVTDAAGVVPKSTVAPVAKPVPVMVTLVPPEVGPPAGEMELTKIELTTGLLYVSASPLLSTAAQKLVDAHDTELSWLFESTF